MKIRAVKYGSEIEELIKVKFLVHRFDFSPLTITLSENNIIFVRYGLGKNFYEVSVQNTSQSDIVFLNEIIEKARMGEKNFEINGDNFLVECNVRKDTEVEEHIKKNIEYIKNNANRDTKSIRSTGVSGNELFTMEHYYSGQIIIPQNPSWYDPF